MWWWARGLPARAQHSKRSVLALDRASGGGGASALSSGIFYLGGGTAVQQACAYQDSGVEMVKFLMASGLVAIPENKTSINMESQLASA